MLLQHKLSPRRLPWRLKGSLCCFNTSPRSYTRRVDTNALAVLDFPAIAERLAAVAATAHGEELARALVPSPDPDEVARRQALTAEVVALLDEAAEPPLDGIRDVREAAAHAARGGALEPEALAPHRGRDRRRPARPRRARGGSGDSRRCSPSCAAAIDPALAPLAKEIGRRVEEDGSDLRDNASPLLRKLRRELRDGRQRVTEELRRLSRAPGLQRAPAGGLRRDARRPARARREGERAAQREGDRPRRVGLGADALRRAVRGRRAEQPPVRGRRATSARRSSGSCASCPRPSAERAARARGARRGHRRRSTWPSRAARSRAAGAARPVEVSDEVRLLGARHPLLDPATAVPIDLDLGDLRALVDQRAEHGRQDGRAEDARPRRAAPPVGLRPPAATAALPVFDEVLADIGDPQSIEMSLSTFSGHIENVRAILRRRDRRARSCSSTSSRPAPTRSRARRSRRRSSAGSPSRRG